MRALGGFDLRPAGAQVVLRQTWMLHRLRAWFVIDPRTWRTIVQDVKNIVTCWHSNKCAYVVSVPGNRHEAWLDVCSTSFCLLSRCFLCLFLQCTELWICCTVTSKMHFRYFHFCTLSEPSTCQKMIAVLLTHTRAFKCLLSNENIVLIVTILAHSLFFFVCSLLWRHHAGRGCQQAQQNW